jgi:hypothetical protein
VGTKIVKISDLTGEETDEASLGKLEVEHPDYQEPVTLEVLPKELDGLKTMDKAVRLVYTSPEGERQVMLVGVSDFDKLAPKGKEMRAILMEVLAAQHQTRAATPQPRRRGRPPKGEAGQVKPKSTVEWGLPHRGRVSPEEAEYVRNNFDAVNRLRSERGIPMLDPSDKKTRDRYGLHGPDFGGGKATGSFDPDTEPAA